MGCDCMCLLASATYSAPARTPVLIALISEHPQELSLFCHIKLNIVQIYLFLHLLQHLWHNMGNSSWQVYVKQQWSRDTRGHVSSESGLWPQECPVLESPTNLLIFCLNDMSCAICLSQGIQVTRLHRYTNNTAHLAAKPMLFTMNIKI